MKQVIYYNHTDGNWYMTSQQNYNSYIQNAREIHKLEDVDNPYEFIENACKWWGAKEEDFIIVYYT